MNGRAPRVQWQAEAGRAARSLDNDTTGARIVNVPKRPETYLAKSECKERVLYRIHSRNLAFGVYKEATGGFLGLREKFGSIFIFQEYHWDNPSFATVRPIEALPETLPNEIMLEESLGIVCRGCDRSVEYRDFPDGPKTVQYECLRWTSVKGEWIHLETSECADIKPASGTNDALERWLQQMEVKYKKV